MEDITKKKHMSFKEIAAYSLGLFGFQAIVGLLNSYQAEFDGSILERLFLPLPTLWLVILLTAQKASSASSSQ